MVNVLCLCRQGQNRSRYIAESLQEKGYAAIYAGVAPAAFNSVNQEMLDWADVIIAARDVHAQELLKRFDVQKNVVSLNITNDLFHSLSMREQVKAQLDALLPL